MEVLLFPFHSWGTGIQTQFTTYPKSLRQSTKKEREKKIHVSSPWWAVPSFSLVK